MNILIVDDSRAMRSLVRRALRNAGFEGHTVEEAENGKLALELVSTFNPGLVLSDWNMPELSGIDFLKALREQGSPVPFFFVTSESTEEMKNLALATGAQGLITKPFTPESVQGTLQGTLV